MVVLCGGNSGSGDCTFSTCLPSVPPSTMMLRFAGMSVTEWPYRAAGLGPDVVGVALRTRRAGRRQRIATGESARARRTW